MKQSTPQKLLTTSLVVAGLFCLLQHKNACAEDWSSIIKKTDYEIFVDIDSYNVSDGLPWITIKTLYKKQQSTQIKVAEKNDKKAKAFPINFFSVMQLQQFNCKSPFFRTKYAHYFQKNGKLIAKDNTLTTFQSIAPNSDVFAVGQLTCQVHQMLGGQ